MNKAQALLSEGPWYSRSWHAVILWGGLGLVCFYILVTYSPSLRMLLSKIKYKNFMFVECTERRNGTNV